MLIIAGLYSVLWAKNIEMKQQCYKEDRVRIEEEIKLEDGERVVELESQMKAKRIGA